MQADPDDQQPEKSPRQRAEAPFGTLSYELILDALDALGLYGDGSLVALNSYENRVYQVGIDGEQPVIVKIYRPARWSEAQILEEHGFLLELAEEEIPVVPPMVLDGRTLHHAGGFMLSVFKRRGGRAPDLDRSDTLEWLGRFLGRIHAHGALKPYQVRPALDVASFGTEPRAFLLDSHFIAPHLKSAYATLTSDALLLVQQAFDRVEPNLIRVHGDCHIGNILWTEHGPHFVDFDDSRSAPAMQDLWMLLSGERHEQRAQMRFLLDGYREFADFRMAELALIEPLRTLRLIHYSAWLARRWHDPAFPVAFPWFESAQYWQDRTLELRDQIDAMNQPALNLSDD
jgi:Ser/Thr protein kinase RdoA (MazF antagonist)